ncbi:serine/threonine-protein kinase, partial [Nocardioides ultimimeridianus]
MIGRYPVSGVIGAGGFGTVYAGTDPVTGEAVAVKVLDWPDQDWRRAMFRHEATALLSIDHPNVVRVREVIDQPGLAALVTDLIDGASLRAVLTHSGPLTGPQALAVLAGALDGLAAVHAAGLVHADLKPENILIDRSGTSRLIDFGLASPPGPLAGPDTWIGTPAYLAPERVLGTFQDARTDLYSTAVVLFELLCGRVPIQGPDALTTAHLQVTQPAPDPAAYVREIGPALAELTRVNLAKDPALRHQNAPAFARSLRHAAIGSFGPGWAAAGALSTTVGAVLGAVPAALGILGAAPVVAANVGAAGAVGAGAAGAV